jgi:hypothetical protein
MAQQATKRAASRGPKVQKVYGLTSMCQVCKQPIRPGHTWKFTEQGGKVHYYCAKQNPAAQVDLSWLQVGDTFAPSFGGDRLKATATLHRNSDGRELSVAVDDVLAFNSEAVALSSATPYRREVGIWATPIVPARSRRGYLRDSRYSLVFEGVPGYNYGEKWRLRHMSVENPAGPTFHEAMVAARQAGAKIGDTSGFEPWLMKAKLDARGPQIIEELRTEFWKGVETGEAPKESASPEQIYHGAKIRKTAAGWITDIDPASVFDDLRQVKQFIDAQQRNPQLTDRAYRYRANANPPIGPKQCAFCGTKQQIQVGHVDGHEENGKPENLIWTCRSCNMLHANALRAAGYGRLTRQYNPKDRGAESYRQYALAVDSIQRRDKKTGALMGWSGKGRPMEVGAAIAMIRATPPDARAQFSREIWRLRRRHYGHTGVYRRSA